MVVTIKCNSKKYNQFPNLVNKQFFILFLTYLSVKKKEETTTKSNDRF